MYSLGEVQHVGPVYPRNCFKKIVVRVVDFSDEQKIITLCLLDIPVEGILGRGSEVSI